MKSLKDKIILITGASEGLGKEITLKLAEEDCKLALLARTESKLIEVKKIVKEKESECEYFVCDLTSPEEITKAVGGVKEKFGGVDILVNNAGIWFEGPTVEHSKEKVQQLFALNVEAPIFLTQEVLPGMIEKGEGEILNISSKAGTLPNGDFGVYTSTKYALRGFTESLQLEMQGKGVKVQGFYPGGMNTQLFNSSGFKKVDEPWMMDIKDISEIIVFMLKQPSDILMTRMDVGKYM